MKKHLTTGECEKITGIKARKIAELCFSGEVEGYKTKSNSYKINIDSLKKWQENHINYIQKPKWLGDSLLAFGNLELDFETNFKPILSSNKSDEIFDTNRNEYQFQYWISNDGRVFDCSTGIYLKPNIKNTYYYVNLKQKNGHYKHFYIHYGVAYYFCKGGLFKNEIHHIDKNPLNNNYKNLLWVTSDEHKELHRLIKKDKKAYRKRVREIAKENNKKLY